MKKTSFLTAAVILLLALNAVTLFIVFYMHVNRPGPRGKDGRGPADYIIKQLKLDDQQQKQFAELREQHHDFTRREHAEEERLHDLYFSMLKQNEPDKTSVDSIASLIGNQRKKMATATFDHFRRLREILHEDQKKLYDNTIDEIARMMGGPPDGPPKR